MINTLPCAHNSGEEANQLKKWILIPLLILAAGVTLTGCGSRGKVGATTAPTAQATTAPTNSPAPIATMEATASPDAAGSATAGMNTEAPMGSMTSTAGSMTPAEAGRLAERISEAVERLSEVDDAEVVVRDSKALVAVEFDDQYSAGLDERMKKMITETVQEVDETLTDVEITDDDTLYGQVKGLGERLAKATGADELADDFGDLWDRVTGM